VSRDNSDLYSGITSVSSEPRTPREVQKAASEKAFYDLKPGVKFIQAAIAQEKENVLDIRSFVLDRTSTEQEVNTELLARKLYLGYLNSLEAKIKQIMKTKDKK
jgi:hypothetical protein